MEPIRYLPLHGKHAKGEMSSTIIDADNYERLSAYHWSYVPKRVRQVDGRQHGYVRTRIQTAPGEWHSYTLHRLVLEIDEQPEGYVIDHINGDPLDNRRSNLRLIPPTFSAYNRSYAPGKSGYRGVREVNGRYAPVLKFKKKHLELGRFDSARDAAKVWDLFTLLVGGEAVVRHTNWSADKYAHRLRLLQEMVGSAVCDERGGSPHGVTPDAP